MKLDFIKDCLKCSDRIERGNVAQELGSLPRDQEFPGFKTRSDRTLNFTSL